MRVFEMMFQFKDGFIMIMSMDFYTKLEGCVNRHAPLKKLAQREVKFKSKP